MSHNPVIHYKVQQMTACYASTPPSQGGQQNIGKCKILIAPYKLLINKSKYILYYYLNKPVIFNCRPGVSKLFIHKEQNINVTR